MIKYHIDEEKRTVVATFDGGKYYWEYSLFRLLTSITDCFHMELADDVIRKYINKGMIRANNEYCGIAKCSPNDTFNAEEGKAIAKERLLKKWKKVKYGCLNEFRTDLWDMKALIERHIGERD